MSEAVVARPFTDPARLDAFWMPFTPNRSFKATPRWMVEASGMYYTDSKGRKILDGMAGLWCVNAGHGRPEIAEAINRQTRQLDFVSSFHMGHSAAFDLADRIGALAPADLNHVFFTNSGSEAVDTALKLAVAYHRARGEGQRTRLIGRARSYHGMGLGGLAVSGIGRHRKDFGALLPPADHLPHTLNLEHTAFSRGQPTWGAHLADELEALCSLHDPSNIAAVIVEPVAGSTGVLPPPQGYLERLRAITEKHGILLIFDEVITGFGRIGAAFGAQALSVTPDIITSAKGLTNGAVPMGAVIASKKVHDALMHGPKDQIEFWHGYTYSGHPLCCAAALAALDVYQKDDLYARTARMAPYWEERLHALKGLPHLIDIRNIGLVAALELSPRDKAAGARGAALGEYCYSQGILVRPSGDLIVLSPPLIIEHAEIDRMVETLAAGLRHIA
jgi:beta-alanine--pyruvate transaminase